MLTTPHLIPLNAGKKLWISPHPHPSQAQWKTWQDLNITALRCLLTPPERQRLNLQNWYADIASQQCELRYYPILDFATPALPDALPEIARDAKSVSAGTGLMVHCNAGIGRSGIWCCVLLMYLGWSAEAAVDDVSTARGKPVPETPAQRDWIIQAQNQLTPIASRP